MKRLYLVLLAAILVLLPVWAQGQTPYSPVIREGLVCSYDPATLSLSDGQAVNVSLSDTSGNGFDIPPSALPTSGLPTYIAGYGSGYTSAPRIRLSGKNSLVTPPGVAAVLGSGNVTIISIAVQPLTSGSAWGQYGFCNGSAYYSGNGSINATGSSNVYACTYGGRIRARRGNLQIGDYEVSPNANIHPYSRYKATILIKESGTWYASRDGMPHQPPYSSDATDPPGSNPLGDIAIGYFGNPSFPANEDLLYFAVYSRALTGDETEREVENFAAKRLRVRNILLAGNSILGAYGLPAEDKPIAHIAAVYNESSDPCYLLTVDAVTGRPYQSMPQYATSVGLWGNLATPMRGPCLLIVEEETNQFIVAPKDGKTRNVHFYRNSFLLQFADKPHIRRIYVNSMKPRNGVSESLRDDLHGDLLGDMDTYSSAFPGFGGWGRFQALDSGSDPVIGAFSSLTNPLIYQPDKTHLAHDGEMTLINDYYLPAIAQGWTEIEQEMN